MLKGVARKMHAAVERDIARKTDLSMQDMAMVFLMRSRDLLIKGETEKEIYLGLRYLRQASRLHRGSGSLNPYINRWEHRLDCGFNHRYAFDKKYSGEVRRAYRLMEEVFG